MDPVSDLAIDAPAPRSGRFSLRARLMMLVSASVVPLVVFTLVRGYVDYQDAVASSGQKTLELTRSLSFAVEKELQARIAVLQVLALSGPLRDGDIDSFRPQADAVVAEQFPGSHILLLREDGQQVLNTLLPQGARLPVRPNLETIRTVFATRVPAVSNTYIGAVQRRYVVSIDVPVRRCDSSIAYVLSVNPEIEAFSEPCRTH